MLLSKLPVTLRCRLLCPGLLLGCGFSSKFGALLGFVLNKVRDVHVAGAPLVARLQTQPAQFALGPRAIHEMAPVYAVGATAAFACQVLLVLLRLLVMLLSLLLLCRKQRRLLLLLGHRLLLYRRLLSSKPLRSVTKLRLRKCKLLSLGQLREAFNIPRVPPAAVLERCCCSHVVRCAVVCVHAPRLRVHACKPRKETCGAERGGPGGCQGGGSSGGVSLPGRGDSGSFRTGCQLRRQVEVRLLLCRMQRLLITLLLLQLESRCLQRALSGEVRV
mmetsp:Transcript_10436/g.31426  ORF Transcript_10436/g.31426 Transcript_10436/m.31426 type:complete len:275 (+) Transcript_10436:2928-3752(+)